MAEVHYFLEVQAKAGRNLAPKDSSGFSDPYLIIRLEKTKVRTKIIDQTLNPTWDQTFSLQTCDPATAILKIECWDKDPLNDDFMGKLEIPVSEVLKENEKRMDRWFKLNTNKKKAHVSGDIHLVLEVKEVLRNVNAEEKGKALEQFHRRFPQISGEEAVLEVAWCGYYHNLISLSQGVLYLTQKYVCYYSNFLMSHLKIAKKTKVVIPLDNVKMIAQKVPLPVLPNGLCITTKENKEYYFTAFLHFSSIYEKVSSRWTAITGLEPATPKQGMLASLIKGASGSSSPTSRSSYSDMPTRPLVIEFDNKTSQIAVDPELTIKVVLQKFAEQEKVVDVDLCDLYYTLHEGKPKKLKKRRKLSSYNLPEKCRLTLSKPVNAMIKPITTPKLNFSTVQEKFDLNKQRSADEMAFEFALHCLLFPVHVSTASAESISWIEKTIQNALGVTDSAAAVIEERANRLGAATESKLIELRHRWNTIDQHPYYNEKSFPDSASFLKWREKERKIVSDMIKEVIYSSPDFYGILELKVLRAENIEAKDVGGTSDPYCIIKLHKQKQKTKSKKKTLSPVWNEDFIFEVCHPREKLQVNLWDADQYSKDDFIDSLSFNLDDLKIGVENRWYGLKKGRIQLEIKYDHTYSSYLKHEETHPRAGESPDSEIPSVDHHFQYTRIAKSLTLEKIGGTKSSLTASTDWFLQEYGNRFGVDWLYRQLVFLDTVACVLQPSVEMLYSVQEVLDDIKLGEIPFTNDEKKFSMKCYEQLLAQTESFFKDFKKLFPKGTPGNPVRCLLEILSLLIKPKTPEEFKTFIANYLDMGVETTFRLLSKEFNEKKSAGSLVDLCGAVQKELELDFSYNEAFPKNFGFPSLDCNLYCSRLTKVVEKWLGHPYTKETMDVYLALKQLNKFVHQQAPDVVLPDVDKMFTPHVYSWLKETVSALHEWVDKSIDQEKKVPISEESLHSTSIVDVTSAIDAFADRLLQFDISDPFLLLQFVEIIWFAGKHYIKKETESVEPLLKAKDPNKPLELSPEVCVVINNIEIARENLDNCTQKLEGALQNMPQQKQEFYQSNKESFDRCVHEAFKSMKELKYDCIKLVCHAVNEQIVRMITTRITVEESDPENAIKPITNYLDDILNVLHKNLYPQLWKSVLLNMFVDLTEQMKEMFIAKDAKTHPIPPIAKAKKLVPVLQGNSRIFPRGRERAVYCGDRQTICGDRSNNGIPRETNEGSDRCALAKCK
eukprot:TRINITY_DN3484_c0_g1_i3.p1 TRINITY_DN3484_c0_g1~~TRINITY_DN3484_c0_g1_i3.p1  ORF type:complete len:1230 (-),score=364.07 TRINITY_DN3484_c0_g1_i3:3410-7099(-)